MNKKSIFITGAGSGIGKATTKHFAKKGWYVGLSDINEETIKAVQQEIGVANSSVHVADVTDKATIQKAINNFSEVTGGKMNAIFNNAGIALAGGFENVALEEQFKVLEVNVNGVMNSTFYALPLLKNTPNSYIISMCSAASVYGSPELTVYCASKSAVKSLTEGWNMAYKEYGIHACDLLVAFVDTPMVQQELDGMKLDAKHVKVTAEQMAEGAWKAVHSKKIHHLIGTDVKVMSFLKWLLPNAWFRSILSSSFSKTAN